MNFFNPVTDVRGSRRLEVLCGIAAILAGVAGMIAMGMELCNPPNPRAVKNAWIAEIAMFVLGAAVLFIGGRMIRGPTPRNPNLLPPFAIYFGALLFLICSSVWLFFGGWNWLPFGFCLGASVTCIYLANRRRKEIRIRDSQWN